MATHEVVHLREEIAAAPAEFVPNSHPTAESNRRSIVGQLTWCRPEPLTQTSRVSKDVFPSIAGEHLSLDGWNHMDIVDTPCPGE